MYSRTVPSHSVVHEVKDAYQSTLPRRSTRERTSHSRAGRPPTRMIVTVENKSDNEIDDSITQLTGMETTPETNNSLRQTRNLSNTREAQKQPKRQLHRTRQNKETPAKKTRGSKHKYPTRATATRKQRQQRKRR